MVLACESILTLARAAGFGAVHRSPDMDRDLVPAKISRPAETARAFREQADVSFGGSEERTVSPYMHHHLYGGGIHTFLAFGAWHREMDFLRDLEVTHGQLPRSSEVHGLPGFPVAYRKPCSSNPVETSTGSHF